MAGRKARAVPGSAGVALVTGASAGIGEAFARRLAFDGYELLLVARRADRLAELAQELRRGMGVRVDVLCADLTRPDDLEKTCDRLRQEKKLSLLVNNAGCGSSGYFAELNVAREQQQIELNVVALTRLTHAALAAMLPQKSGALINLSSMAGFSPAPFTATYAATKAFVTSFTESLAEELRDSGVRVQALCPGLTRTEFQDEAGVNPDAIPSLLWMDSEAVVDASLLALENGDLICVPGFANRMASYAVGAIPRRVLSRVTGTLTRRLAAH